MNPELCPSIVAELAALDSIQVRRVCALYGLPTTFPAGGGVHRRLKTETLRTRLVESAQRHDRFEGLAHAIEIARTEKGSPTMPTTAPSTAPLIPEPEPLLLEPVFATAAPRPPRAPAAPRRPPVLDDDAAAQLAALRQILAQGAPIDPEAIRELVRAEIAAATPPPCVVEIRTPAVTTKIDGAHCQMGELAALVNAGCWVLLWGPPGTGKSHAGEQLAEALGRTLYLNGALDSAHQIVGYQDGAGTYHTTPAREAYERGNSLWLWDEMDASLPPATMAAQGMLANGFAWFPDSPLPVRMGANVSVILTANTMQGHDIRHTARHLQDKAFLDRLEPLNWRIDEALERRIALAIAPDAGDLVTHVQDIRAKALAAGLDEYVSPRRSLAAARMLASGMAPAAIRRQIAGRFNEADRRTLGLEV